MTEKLIILGSGPAGLTAALYAARSGLNPLVIEGPEPGGLLMGTSYIENWPGTQRILGPKLMADMRQQVKSFGTRFLSQELTNADFSGNPFVLTFKKQEQLRTHALIIATGATPRRLGCPGEKEYWGKGVTTCAVCDGAFYKDKEVLIVGGGDTAMENASFMTNYTSQITIVQNLDRLTASQVMQERVLNNPHITILYSSSVERIDGDGQRVTHIVLKNTQTQQEQKRAIDAVFIAVGLQPNTLLFKGKLELNQYGYMIQKEHTQTSVPGVFAAGDVADYRYRQAITSAGNGCMAALDAERYLKNQKL